MLEERLKERFKDYKNALVRLNESCSLDPNNDIVIDGVIQRFEFTFELSWKLIKLYLEYVGLGEENSPRNVIKLAYKAGILSDGDAWINMMIDRNKTSHIYDAALANEIYNNIKSKHTKLLEELLEKMVSCI